VLTTLQSRIETDLRQAEEEENNEEGAPPEPEYNYYGKTYVKYIRNKGTR
jgi:hypothetical protein